ncbi:MAG TPA: ATP-binding protein, partial [Anaerolineales bacterium]|nr:ATP-binding protein [Anaerolineales bacterium]
KSRESTVTVERKLVRSDGELIDVVLKTQPERDLNGDVVSVRAMFTDITELNQLQSKIVASQKLADLGTLAAGVAHEMNSPLQVITGMSQSLLKALDKGTLTPEKLHTNLETINRNAWRCAEIARALRTYAHSSGGTLEPLDLNVVIRDALLLTEHQLRSWSNIEIETDLFDLLPPTLCDRNQIAQVLINLLTNAMKFTPAGGSVSLSAGRRPDGSTAIEVSDTGPGIAEEDRARIFETFGQGRHDVAAQDRGVGLGLPIVRGIVE